MQVANHTTSELHQQSRPTLCQTVELTYEELTIMRSAVAGIQMRWHETCIGTGKQHGYQASATSRTVQGLQSVHNVVQHAKATHQTRLRQC